MLKIQYLQRGQMVVQMIKKEVALVLFARFPSEMAYGTHIVQVARGFEKNGYKVNVYYPKTYNKKTLIDSPEKFYRSSSINFIEVENIDITSYRIYNFLPRLLQMTLYTFFGLLWSRKIIKEKNQEEIVWSTNPNLLLGITKYFKYAIFEKHGQARYFQKLSTKILSSRKNVFMIALSKKSEEELISITKRAKYLPNGVDLDLFKPTKSNNASLGIGYVGMLETYNVDKGVFAAVEEIILLNERFSLFTTIAGGPKKKLSEIENLIKLHNQESRFNIKDYVPHFNVPKLLENVDIGIVPYPEDQHISNYASPLKIFELASMGIPILASDITSHLDLEEFSLGIVFYKNGNFKDFAFKLETLITNKNLRDELSRRSLKNIKKLSWENRTKILLSSVRSSIG